MFGINEYVIYKNEVCIVKEIKKDNYLNKDCYILKPISDNSLLIQVPVDNKKGFIKNIIEKADAIKLLDSISRIEPIVTNSKITDNDYKNLFNTNNKEDLIKIIKTTYLEINKRKQIGKKEREVDTYYLEKTMDLLCNELSISLNDSKENIRNFIYEKLKNM